MQQLLRGAASVMLQRCDTAARSEADAAVAAAAGRHVGGGSVGGLLLAGGVLSDAMLPSQTAGQLSF